MASVPSELLFFFEAIPWIIGDFDTVCKSLATE